MIFNKRLPLTLNIQHFAEENPPADTLPPGDNPEGDKLPGDNPPKDEKPKDPPEKTFSEEQLEKIVKDRLARAEKDKEKAIQEAQKLAKMNADEKQKYELEKLQEENRQLKAEQNRYSLGKEATKMLAEAGIIADDETLDFVVREDAETTKSAVQNFSALIQSKVDAAVKEALKGTPPKKAVSESGALTKTSILAMKDSSARIKAIQENPHLFK